MIGSMADNLGQAPLRAQQEDSYMPYFTSIGTPLAVGALAGLGTNGSTGQFVNNLANPLAGTGDLIKGAVNKGTTFLENNGIRTSIAPELREGLRTNGFEMFNLNSVRKPSGSIGNQGATSEGANSILNSLDIKVKGVNPNEVTLKEMVEHLKNNPKDAQKYQKFLEENPISVNELPGGEFHINDGHHRATLSYYSGKEEIPTIIKNKGEYTAQPSNNSFKSEIDWSKWNKETPENKALMQEYNAIEQQAKANGTWMKNPDGSEFVGSKLTKDEITNHPKLSNDITNEEIAKMQFLQQRTQNHKDAFSDYYGNILHHRSKNEFNTFDESKFGSTDYGYHGKGIYAGEEGFRTARYGDIPYELYVNTKNKGVNPKYNEFYRKDLNESLNTLEKRYLQEKNLPKEFPEHYPNIEKYNNTLDTNFEKDITELIKNKKQLDNYDLIKVGNEVVIPFDNPVKSAIGNNGMFDMTNPDIYKSVLPIGLGASYMSTQETPKYQQGGNYTEAELNFLSDIAIKDNQGQYNHPGKVTEINSPNITMKGLDYSVLGISKETGEQIKMQPNKDYFFKNTKNVIEIPTKKNKNG